MNTDMQTTLKHSKGIHEQDIGGSRGSPDDAAHCQSLPKPHRSKS